MAHASPVSNLKILAVSSCDSDIRVVENALEQHECLLEVDSDDRAIRCFTANNCDALIVDLRHSPKSSLDLIRQVRRDHEHAAILALTDPDEINIRTAAIKLGADDYLISPLSAEKLLDRLMTILQQKHDAASMKIVVADLIVDCKKRTASRGGRKIDLTPREYELLRLLAGQTGNIISRTEIRDRIYNGDTESTSNIVDVYIRYLRKKIELPGQPKLLHTFRGRGYMLGQR